MTRAPSPNFKFSGIIATAHARMKSPHPRYPVRNGIHIDRYAISEEQFHTQLQILLSDKDIFSALLTCAAHGVRIEIGGAYGDWIFLDENGKITIRHDIGILRIKEFFGIPISEKE